MDAIEQATVNTVCIQSAGIVQKAKSGSPVRVSDTHALLKAMMHHNLPTPEWTSPATTERHSSLAFKEIILSGSESYDRHMQLVADCTDTKTKKRKTSTFT